MLAHHMVGQLFWPISWPVAHYPVIMHIPHALVLFPSSGPDSGIFALESHSLLNHYQFGNVHRVVMPI